MKVSFDFDGTLSRKDVQRFAKELVDKGYDVWIVTSRVATEPALAKGWYWVEKQNQELYNVAEQCGIPKEKIVFTEHVDKIVFLKDKEFLFHLDDDEYELMEILRSKDTCKPLNVGHSDWEYYCREIINNENV
jgi:hypothetical protein